MSSVCLAVLEVLGNKGNNADWPSIENAFKIANTNTPSNVIAIQKFGRSKRVSVALAIAGVFGVLDKNFDIQLDEDVTD
ncbi:hypothetical protein EV182_001269, partial [Spiromyces aspiralis]